MLNLILAIVIGFIFSLVAIQNSTPVSLQLGNNILFPIPLYLVAFASFVVGVLLSSLFSFAEWTNSAFTIAGKNSQLNKTQNLLADLRTRLEQLELENAQLRGERSEADKLTKTQAEAAHLQAHLEDNPHTHLSFLDRLRYRLAI